MGASGTGIRDDDVVCDVIGTFTDHLKAGKSIAEASRLLVAECTDFIGDSDDGPLFWIGLAESQWTFGGLDPEVLAKVKADFDTGHDLERWREVSEIACEQRRKVLTKFIQKVSSPNPRPRKTPKMVVRPPVFSAGDCLSVRMNDGSFVAAFVTASDASDPEYGRNLVGVLDWSGAEPPPLDVFASRRFLRVRHHAWDRVDVSWYLRQGFKAERERIQRIGNLPVHQDDPRESTLWSAWRHLGDHVRVQRDWDREHPPKKAELAEGLVICHTCWETWQATPNETVYFCRTCTQWVTTAE